MKPSVAAPRHSLSAARRRSSAIQAALFALLLLIVLSVPAGWPAARAAAAPPNVLFIIADDASATCGQAYGCNWVKTPHIDRLAREGLVFENMYTPTSKCAPSRASLLTGRNPWQLEEAANHQPYFPNRYVAFTEALARAGVHCGGAGKTWGPGDAKTADGAPRDFGLTRPQRAREVNQPGVAPTEFLRTKPAGAPFFYWFGSNNPHRPYAPDSGLAAGKKSADIPRVPAYLPDTEVVRRDLLDYAIEVEAYDTQVGSLLEALERSGEARNTLVIVTSDHGMPFPRVKGHTYEDAHHIPFVARWPEGIVRPGRRVGALLSFVDLAPTLLELLAVNSRESGMAPVTGHSFTELLRDRPGRERPFVIVGRERNDVLARPGTPAGLGYPARAIREGEYFYVHNFAPDRWPCGNPELGLTDTDDGPTKRLLRDRGERDPYWQHAFGKRPAEQLFHLPSDPDCVKNLADDPAHRARAAALRQRLFAELKRQEDPRVLDRGDVFDRYPSPRAAGR